MNSATETATKPDAAEHDAPIGLPPDAEEHSAPEETPAPELPSPEAVHAWLAQAKPADVLALLRKPDFAYMTANAFAGARVNAIGYGLPHVRGRLAQEAIKNDKFTEKLRALAEAAAALPQTPPPILTPALPAEHSHSEREQLKAERERSKTLRTERDTARAALTEADAARQQACHEQAQAEAARAESDAQAQEQARKTSRLERRITQLQQEIMDISAERDTLQKAAKPKSPEPASPPTREREQVAAHSAEQISPWQTAAAHLLNRSKSDAALMLAEEVLRLVPGDTAALDLAARACEARQEPAQAAEYVRLLLDHALAQRRTAEAAEAWLRLVRLSTPAHAEKPLRSLLRALRPEDAAGVRQMRLALTRLHGLAPATHAQAAAQVTQFASPALADALMPLPGALTDDDRLPLDLPSPITVARLLTAVRAGDEAIVTEARASLERLAVSSRDNFERIRTALVRVAGDDPSLLQPLLRAPRGAAIVDASNVALHGQSDLVSPRPRLRALLAMRRALLERGFFPILMIGDANLPHIIDEPGSLEEMRARREVRFVDSGTVADEVLLREAKHHGAPLVTNDHMTDWDPRQQVPKIQFTFSLSGSILFDS